MGCILFGSLLFLLNIMFLRFILLLLLVPGVHHFPSHVIFCVALRKPYTGSITIFPKYDGQKPEFLVFSITNIVLLWTLFKCLMRMYMDFPRLYSYKWHFSGHMECISSSLLIGQFPPEADYNNIYYIQQSLCKHGTPYFGQHLILSDFNILSN